MYCFFEVAKAQSLKKGAEQLGVAPSTLSEQIKRLEEEMNHVLFKRSSRGLIMTDDGKLLYEHARVIFEEGYRVLEKFSDDSLGGYSVNVGIEDTLSNDIAAEFSSQYWDLYASFGTVNTVRQSDSEILMNNILHDVVDWGITLREAKHKELESEEIGSFRIVFCCSSDLYRKFKDPKDILRNIPFAESSSDFHLNQKLSQYLEEHQIFPKEKIASDHPEFIRKLCLRGRCVMVMPENPMAEYDGLTLFQLSPPLTLKLYAVWKKANLSMVSISKLKELIQTKISQVPDRYEDVNLQIEVSDIPDDLLK